MLCWGDLPTGRLPGLEFPSTVDATFKLMGPLRLNQGGAGNEYVCTLGEACSITLGGKLADNGAVLVTADSGPAHGECGADPVDAASFKGLTNPKKVTAGVDADHKTMVYATQAHPRSTPSRVAKDYGNRQACN